MLEKHEGAYEVGSVALSDCSTMICILCVQEFLEEEGVPDGIVKILFLGDNLVELLA
jgi:hypothetical protein